MIGVCQFSGWKFLAAAAAACGILWLPSFDDACVFIIALSHCLTWFLEEEEEELTAARFFSLSLLLFFPFHL